MSRNRLRIALVGDWFLPRLGGIELQVRDLAHALIAEGHAVEVVCGVPGESAVEGIPVRRLAGARLAGLAVTPAAYRELHRLLREGRFDVVHVQFGIIAPIAHEALRFCAAAGIPAVATFHSVLAYYGPLLRLLDRTLGYSRWPVRYVGVSGVVAEAMRPLVGAAPVAVVPNGIDTAYWRRSGPAAPPSGPVEVVSVMRLEKRKRPRALIEAFAAAVRGLPEGAARLTVVGDGGESAALARLVARRGLEGRVRLVGRRSRAEIRDLLHGSHVFALASRLEAFGIACLEARAAGLPVVTMAASGARDFLRHGEDALLAADDAALATHLRRLIVEPSLLAKLTEAAARPLESADWHEVAPRYLAEYRLAMAMAAQASPERSPRGSTRAR